MITDAILFMIWSLIHLLVVGLGAILPIGSLPAQITSAITSASGYLTAINYVLPVATLSAVIGIFVTFETAIFAYKGVMWIIKKIPGVS